ncbi:polysaccharide deacetylase family protein [Devosia sp. 2618]|uniref:polysaccharide deacetylase family protein n=1 Tax=Devosia sp. 2618 TaxID=3156454 RepID=UPI0033928C7F
MSSVIIGLALGGCAKPPTQHVLAYQPVVTTTNSILTGSQPITKQPLPERIFSASHLGGRTMAVSSTNEIALRPGEVILTFDDGPRPGKTNEILATLDDYGVKATFLMLGSAAQAHPNLAQQVATRGHSVGSHTFDHVDLTKLSRQEALDEIARGERAVSLALAGSGHAVAPFFRFPYLSQTSFLRTSVMQGNMVVLDVDIDSKDYYKDTADVVAKRTMDRLDTRGSGIILFHDIHQRTVDMLPAFLAELKARGYSVVRLVPKDNSVFGRDVITAEAPERSETL